MDFYFQIFITDFKIKPQKKDIIAQSLQLQNKKKYFLSFYSLVFKLNQLSNVPFYYLKDLKVEFIYREIFFFYKL